MARLSLTPCHREARIFWRRERFDWRVEWCSVLFSDERSFCLYASDEHACVRCRSGERHLPECILPRHPPHLRLHGVGAIIYSSRSDLLFLQGKVNNSRYMLLAFNSVLLPFLRQKGGELFQQNNAVHIQLLRRNVLFVVYNCPGQQHPKISLQLKTYGT